MRDYYQADNKTLFLSSLSFNGQTDDYIGNILLDGLISYIKGLENSTFLQNVEIKTVKKKKNNTSSEQNSHFQKLQIILTTQAGNAESSNQLKAAGEPESCLLTVKRINTWRTLFSLSSRDQQQTCTEACLYQEPKKTTESLEMKQKF